MYFCSMFTKNQYVKLCGLFLLAVLLTTSCNRPEVVHCDDYRQAMRDLVVRISETARAQTPDFIVIPQNGIELVTVGEDADAELAVPYLAAIDGHGQELFDSLPVIDKGEILLLGEYHYLEEILSLEADVIKHTARLSQDTLEVFLELPYNLNYYIDRLFHHNDSISLLRYMKTLQSKVLEEYLRRSIFSIYGITLQHPKLRVFCVDANKSIYRFFFTLDMLFSNYSQAPESIQSIRDFIRQIVRESPPKTASEDAHLAKELSVFQKHFKTHRKDYSNYLTGKDFFFVDKNLNNFSRTADEREELMYRNISQQYKSHYKFIMITGVVHANKEKIQFTKKIYTPNAKPLAWKLNNNKKSPFFKKVYSICIAPQQLCFRDSKSNDSAPVEETSMPFPTPQMPYAVKQELSKRNQAVTIMIMSKIKSPKPFDGYILIRDAHSMIR